MTKGFPAVFLCGILILAACSGEIGDRAVSPQPASSSTLTVSEPVFSEAPALPNPADELPSTEEYIHQLVRSHVDKIERPA